MNVRKFVVKATHLDDLVGLGTLPRVSCATPIHKLTFTGVAPKRM